MQVQHTRPSCGNPAFPLLVSQKLGLDIGLGQVGGDITCNLSELLLDIWKSREIKCGSLKYKKNIHGMVWPTEPNNELALEMGSK